MPYRHTLKAVKFDWDPEKNEQLKKEPGISFEEIALLLGTGKLWAISKHWNERKYPNQRVFLLPIDGYIHAVPFVRDRAGYFLKTAFPSRKLTKQYRKELQDNESR